MPMRLVSCLLLVVCAGVSPAFAGGLASPYPVIHFGDPAPVVPAVRPFNFTLSVGDAAAIAASAPTTPAQTPVTPVFEYSDGYKTRAKIHKLASWLMLPAFGVEAYLGQKMFNDVGFATEGHKALHKGIAWGIGGLFVANTVTGVPNLLQERRDPAKSDRTLIHGVLMLIADAGFLATALTRPDSRTAEGLQIYTPKKNQHLTIAYASISVASVGYLLMLLR